MRLSLDTLCDFNTRLMLAALTYALLYSVLPGHRQHCSVVCELDATQMG